MVFRPLALGLACCQFEGFVYVDGLARREPGRYQVPSLSKIENVSKWGFVVAFDTVRALRTFMLGLQ